MSFTPDVPPQALGPSEYNSGFNIQTNVRGIEPVLGDLEILNTIPGTQLFVSAGFRDPNVFYLIVATTEGRWWAIDGGGITEVTPTSGYINTYTADTEITDCWSGNVLFINDGINPPMYLLPNESNFRLYDNGPDNYQWNYTPATFSPTWTATTAGFMRIYATPNVGSILIAGNITAQLSNGTSQNFPTTVRWSQAFGLNAGPTTWAPTTTNVANELEVPVRGPVVDGFPCAGNFYVCSYWDTVIFSPLAYQSSNNPVLGIKLFAIGLLPRSIKVNFNSDLHDLHLTIYFP
jgi:hypothetical protein